jgi:hypothetical protein
MVEPPHHSGFDFDQSDHMAKHARPRPTGFLSRKDRRSRPHPEDKGYLWRRGEGNVRLQGSFYPEQ